MLKLFLRFNYLIFSLLAFQKMSAQNFYAVDDTGNVKKIELSTCKILSKQLNNPQRQYANITFHPNGKLYALQVDSIFEMDSITGNAKFIYRLTNNRINLKDSVYYFYGMTVSCDGLMYLSAPGKGLYTFDPKTLKEVFLGDIQVKGISKSISVSDLFFYSGDLYCDTRTEIIKINLSDPTKSSILFTYNGFPKGKNSAVEDGIFNITDCKKNAYLFCSYFWLPT